MPTYVSNHYLAEKNKGNIDFTSNIYKCILMTTGFTFNRDTHSTLANVSASELAGGNGYTTGGQTLANVDTTNIEDDTNDRSYVTWDDVVWTASGGDIGPIAGAIVYDDTTVDDTVIGYIEPSSEQTATDGNTMVVAVAIQST